MNAIYEPAGRAREYAELACNLFSGCTHGCLYCYAPAVVRRDREEFHRSVETRPGIIDALERDAAKLAGDKRKVLLCFTTDPYQQHADLDVTREAIKALHSHGLGVRILTKAVPLLVGRDIDLIGPDDEVWTTLVFASRYVCKQWEPGAPWSSFRMAALRELKHAGIRTGVSFEPIIEQDETLELIERVADCCDYYALGRWNHDARAKGIDYAAFLGRAIPLLEKIGKPYLIKADLAEYLGESDG